MKNKAVWFIVGAIVIVAAWYFFGRGKSRDGDVEYRYAPVTRGEVLRSVSATGLCVALTQVDVKSKAGGRVVKLAVDLGDVVKKGDLIALIDPSDTEASYQQAEADLRSSQANAQQSGVAYQMQIQDSATAVADARTALHNAQVALDRAKLTSDRQPALTSASVNSAQAAYDEAKANQQKLLTVTVPQTRRDAQATADRTKIALDTANANLERQQNLLQRGYVSQATVDQARSAAASAKSDYTSAQQRMTTLNQELQADVRAQALAVQQAKAALDQALANRSQVQDARKSYDAAKLQLQSSGIALQKAINDQKNNDIRKFNSQAAQAATVRNRVAVQNAKVQLDSTTVVAPRSGVVTTKYLEEGTIIPPGTSTFAQGTSLVQISDVTQLYVDCTVDEADIAGVSVNQRVEINADAYPGQSIPGVVTRVNPIAATANSITSVTVRVKVQNEEGGKRRRRKVHLMPGMNATCKFILDEKQDVLTVPSQAVSYKGGKPSVRVQVAGSKTPQVREVKVGITGDDSTEILSGVKEGEQVVTAEIDLQMLRQIQQQLAQSQDNAGLTGGGPRRPQSRASGAGGGGGRGGGGGGGR